MPTEPVRGGRHPQISPECIAIEIVEAWLRLCKRNARYGPAAVSITPRGKVLVGYDADRYAHAVEVGTFTSAISLSDLRDEVYHVWESMQR